MSYTNFVQLKLAAAATAAQTTLVVTTPAAPFAVPAANGSLTLLDIPDAPTKAEIVTYTTVTNNGDGTHTLGGVVRAQEGTTAQAWAIGAGVFQSLTAAQYAADLGTKQATHGNLAALSGLVGAADKLPYFTGAGALSVATLTAKARGLLASADEAAMRTFLGLGSAAVAAVTASAYDTTVGRVLKVGDFGVGGVAIRVNDFNAITTQGRYFNGAPDSVGLPYAEYWQVEHLPSYISTVFSQRATGTGSGNLGHIYTRSTISGAAGLSPWTRLQQQKDYLVGASYVECLHATIDGSPPSITIYTKIPAVDGVMWTIKIEGAAGTYTSPISAIIAGYFYGGAPYLPTMTVTAADATAFTSAKVGVVDGKIVVRISGVGYLPRFAVSAIRSPGGLFGAPDDAYTGWSYGTDQTTLPNVVAVTRKRTPVLSNSAELSNTHFTNTIGAYEHLHLGYMSGAVQFGIMPGNYWYLKTNIDLLANLGTPAYRWLTVYAGTGAINTSDARHKTPVQPLASGELAVARQLAGEIGTFRWNDSVAEKGDAARHHFGITVQRVMEVFAAHDLDPFRYGMVCHDVWGDELKEHPEEVIPTTTPAVVDQDGNEAEAATTSFEVKPAYTEVVREAGDIYSLRMDQLALFLARGQAQRQDELEARIAALEAQPWTS